MAVKGTKTQAIRRRTFGRVCDRRIRPVQILLDLSNRSRLPVCAGVRLVGGSIFLRIFTRFVGLCFGLTNFFQVVESVLRLDVIKILRRVVLRLSEEFFRLSEQFL